MNSAFPAGKTKSHSSVSGVKREQPSPFLYYFGCNLARFDRRRRGLATWPDNPRFKTGRDALQRPGVRLAARPQP
jgi:hypothetical protein